jgi:uncharacterized membrane protein
MPFDNKEILDMIAKNWTWAWIASIGWFAHYIYKVSKGESFRLSRLLINMCLAWWIGYLCQEIGLTSFWVSIAWFCTYPLLNLIEIRGAKIVSEMLLKKE